MKESEFQTLFTRWAKHNLTTSTATELKITNTDRFYIRNLADHQRRNLLNTKHHGIYYKIPDVGFDQKPYDGFFIKGDAYVCIMFFKPRTPKKFYAIDIDEFVKIKTPSITEDDASKIATLVGDLLPC